MLARLDEIAGVAESRVDWTGRRFLLRLEPASKQAVVAELAADALGDDAVVLGRDQALAWSEEHRRGEAWMRAGETLRLSRHEARVLAERFGTEAAQEIELSDDATRKLVGIFEGELYRAFERKHDGKTGVPTREEFEVAAQRILEASREFLDADDQQALGEYLEAFAGPPGR